MFYYPLLDEIPSLYYFPSITNRVCTWAVRGKALLASDCSKIDWAYPYSGSTSIEWFDFHNTRSRLRPSATDWTQCITNSAMFYGAGHFMGFWNGTDFYEYDAASYNLKSGVTAIPSSILDLTALSLDDVDVPSTQTVKDMVVVFE